MTGENYLIYFSISCSFLFLCTLPFLKTPIPKPFKGVFIRGAMYALTNFLLLAAQNRGTVSSSLASALIGSMAVSLPALLKPPYRIKNGVIVFCILLGVWFLMDQIKLSYLALISGIIQAITFASASRVMRVHQIPISWNLVTGFGMVAIFGGIFSIFEPIGKLSDVHLVNFLIVSGVIICSQLSFFQLYKSFSTESAGRYSLGRIPWAYLIDMIYSHTLAAPHTIIGVVFLSAGSFIRKERRSIRR